MVGSRNARVRAEGLQPVQILSGLVGLIYLAIGIFGFVRTGISDFTGADHPSLLGFAINPLHNLLHIATGVLGVLMMFKSSGARLFGWLLLIGYGVLFVWGLLVRGVFATNPVADLGNPLNLNTADNWLHLGTALVGLAIAVVPARKVAWVDDDLPAPDAPQTIDDTAVEGSPAARARVAPPPTGHPSAPGHAPPTGSASAPGHAPPTGPASAPDARPFDPSNVPDRSGRSRH